MSCVFFTFAYDIGTCGNTYVLIKVRIGDFFLAAHCFIQTAMAVICEGVYSLFNDIY